MILAVGMSTGLTLIQTIGAYLRYLPFEEKLTMEERTRLWKYILLWMPVSFTIYLAYFSYAGVDVFTYKHVHYFGWIPFFAFSLVVIRNEGMRHLFVAGMQALWFMLLQTISGTLILTFMPPFYGTGVNRLPVQTAFYIFFFIVLLPVEHRIFRKLLPTNMFTGSKIAGWCFAMLPLGICAAPLITLRADSSTSSSMPCSASLAQTCLSSSRAISSISCCSRAWNTMISSTRFKNSGRKMFFTSPMMFSFMVS